MKFVGGGGVIGHSVFEKIISLDNLFLAWDEFKKGKMNKIDIQEFEYNLENNIFKLHEELKIKNYCHSDYVSFYITDPKLRKIHKATVKDRVLHHAVFRILYPIFDKTFIFDSYSCRTEKGTHAAVDRLNEFLSKQSKNNSRNCFVLKCDIRKFFASISQDVLIDIIKKKINDNNAIWIVERIIKSFPDGLPLGNITSQLFANIYLNELDQFIKHILKIKYYIRYCDDFVILSESPIGLNDIISYIDNFLRSRLRLFLHPRKIIVRKYRQGIDFLGYVNFPYHKILRTKTKNRILRKISRRVGDFKGYKITEESFNQSIQSYMGVLKHCCSKKIKIEIFKILSGKG